MGRKACWSFLRGAVIQITAARTKQLKDQMTGPATMFHLQYFLDGLSLAFQGCSLEGNLQLGFFFRDTGTLQRASVVFLLWWLFFPAKPWKCAVAFGVAVMWCWLHYSVAVSQPPGTPGGQSAGSHQSVTTAHWWLSNATHDSRD